MRIGGVSYCVGAPLVTGLEQRQNVELTLASPRHLVTMLRAGKLDAALASSIEAFRHPGWLAMSDLGIACEDRVRSVRLFLRTEPAAVRSLAVDNGSATSVALSQVLLVRRFGATIDHAFDIEPTRTPDAIDADAVLLIGDAGLLADAGGRAALDLGEEWRSWTGLPFVFALWLVAGGDKAIEDGTVRNIVGELRRARALGIEQAVDDGTGGLIRYDLDDRHLAGLRRFRSEALALGLCNPVAEPVWMERG